MSDAWCFFDPTHLPLEEFLGRMVMVDIPGKNKVKKKLLGGPSKQHSLDNSYYTDATETNKDVGWLK